MMEKFNHLLDNSSNFLAARKGLLPTIGILLVVVNGILQFIPSIGWLAESNIILHIGIIIAIFGIMLAWAL
jgi:uncharacterized membrane protein